MSVIPIGNHETFVTFNETVTSVPEPAGLSNGDMVVIAHASQQGGDPMSPPAGFRTAIADTGVAQLHIHWGIRGTDIPAGPWDFTGSDGPLSLHCWHVFAVQGDVDETSEWSWDSTVYNDVTTTTFDGPTLNTALGNRERIYFNIGTLTRGESQWTSYFESGTPFPTDVELQVGGGGSSASYQNYGWLHALDLSASLNSVDSGQFVRSSNQQCSVKVFTIALTSKALPQTTVMSPPVVF